MTIYAEDVNFWHTGKSDPGKWMDLARKQIIELGGKVKGEGFGSDSEGRGAFMLAFELEGEMFKIIWPILPTRYRGQESATRRQAATMLYHYVKSVALYSVVVGSRAAFFSHLMLPDGRVASQVANDELVEALPAMLLLNAGPPSRRE